MDQRAQIHACQNCGAPLAIPDEHDRFFRCRSCGSVLEDRNHGDATTGTQIVINIAADAEVDPRTLRVYAGPRKTQPLSRRAKFTLLGVAAALGVMVVVAITTADEPLGPGEIRIDGEALAMRGIADVVPAGSSSADGAPTDALAFIRTDGPDRLVAVDPDGDPAARWAAPLAGEARLTTPVVVDDDLLVVATGSAVEAFDRADGDRVWTAELSDEVDGGLCTDCLALVEGAVATLSIDGTVAVHDLADGTPRWTHRLDGTPDRLLHLDDSVAVIDGADGAGELVVLGLADGEVRQREPVGCVDDLFGDERRGAVGRVAALADGSVLHVAHGPRGCAQRFVPGRPGPAWEVALPTDGEEDAEFAFARDIDVIEFGDEVLVIGQTTLDAYDMATGNARRVLSMADTDLALVGATDSTLVLGAESTRGSTTWELLGIHVAAADVRWQRPVAATTYLNTRGPFGEEVWTATVGPEGIRLADATAAGIALALLDPDEGTETEVVTADADRPDGVGAVFGWSGSRLLVGVRSQLVFVDATDGEVVARAF